MIKQLPEKVKTIEGVQVIESRHLNPNITTGYKVILRNGWTVSIQCAPATYCSNHDADMLPLIHGNSTVDYLESPDAEVAAWDSKENWYTFEGDNTVQGYQSLDDCIDFIRFISLINPEKP